MTYVAGRPPETKADWRRVAAMLRELHRLTQGWPQRPGWRSSTDLLQAEVGTEIKLRTMPPEGVDDDGAHDIAAQASAAWEAAVCWADEYAVMRLAEVRAV
jgi:Ser/Thr protein kinase RdoA (MazF antagonist)